MKWASMINLAFHFANHRHCALTDFIPPLTPPPLPPPPLPKQVHRLQKQQRQQQQQELHYAIS